MTDAADRIELAKLIANRTDLDWGAHNLAQGQYDDEHGRDPICEGCAKVADAVLAAGWRKSDARAPRPAPAKEHEGDILPLPATVERYGSPFPRRQCMDQWTAVEREIWKAHDLVESMPASVHLTNAVILLAKAAGKVADYLEGNPDAPAVHINTRDEHGVSQPISPDLANAVHQAAMVIRESEARSVPATAEPPDGEGWVLIRKAMVEAQALWQRSQSARMDAIAAHVAKKVAALHPVRSDARADTEEQK